VYETVVVGATIGPLLIFALSVYGLGEHISDWFIKSGKKKVNVLVPVSILIICVVFYLLLSYYFGG